MHNVLREGWHRLLAIFLVLILQGCERRSTSTMQWSAPNASTAASNPYCTGRLMFFVPGKLHISGNTDTFYWADVQTFRESYSQYQVRVQRAVTPSSPTGQRYVRSKIPLPRNHGVLLLLHEEERPPIDPSAVTILGYAYVNGTSFEFRKRSAQRLAGLAQQRVAAILGGVRGTDPGSGPAEAGAFCVPSGSIPGRPAPGWFESSVVEGSFDWKGTSLRFRLKSVSLNSADKNAPALAEARSFLPEVVGKSEQEDVSTIFQDDYAITLGAMTGTARVIRLRSSDKMQEIFEWHRPAAAGDPFTPAIVLHIWASAPANTRLPDELSSKGSQRHQSIFQILPVPRADGLPLIAQPVAEESMTVYRARFIDPHSGEPSANFAYQVFKGNDLVDEGRTDAAGYPRAQNIDYYEDLTFRALPNL